ncbi:hypothetical protein [Streptomyces sp. NE06-03C]|uniref:hypothetical protein n=1 Tax=Streptomyces sp. NE06-03C TaxID=3028694 RepID=UPI0029A95E0F|nr:hypothetical protein [Streptomyces sp. NE06-03C]MDX2921310.1 hypothetical protein [Streptomyces sp. NE06-03C]
MRAAVVRRLRARLGRRGPFLLFMGIGKTCWGLGLIVQPPNPAGLELLTGIAPLHCWAWVWVLAGVVTFASAWVRFGQDRFGFLAASVPPALWAFVYGWSALLGEYPRGIFIFLWYITSHCGVIWCASRVPPGGGRARPAARVEGSPG